MFKYSRVLTKIALSMAIITLLICPPVPLHAEVAQVVPLWGPYLTGVSETGITVNWKTEGASEGAVEYAVEDFYSENSSYSDSVPDSLQELHHVTLTGLQPDTIYHYRVSTGEEYTDDHVFTTLGDGPFTFIVYGDTREQAPALTQLNRHKLVADRIAQEQGISFVLHTGDLVFNGDDLGEWGRFFEAGRQMLSSIPFFPVAGNHENNSSDYYDTFGVAPYYSFNCANAHFALLDSNDGADLDAEAAWLSIDLSVDTDWKFAVCHHPLYTSDSNHWGGNTDLQEHWEPVFMENGINAVFNAHVHVYERDYENDIHYITIATGGAPSYALAEAKIPGYRNSFEHTLGYARITVNGTEASMDVIKVADLSEDNAEIINTYPPNTIFETVNLLPENDEEPPDDKPIDISINVDSITYGNVKPGGSSLAKPVTIENTGKSDVNITLELKGDDLALDFFEHSLYVNGAVYDPAQVICTISSKDSEVVSTRLLVPSNWDEMGLMQITFIFWAEAP
jgi:acid phosphatase type 7